MAKKGTLAVVTVPMTKTKTTSILGEISTTGLINVSLRVPKHIKKRNNHSTISIMDTDSFLVGKTKFTLEISHNQFSTTVIITVCSLIFNISS